MQTIIKQQKISNFTSQFQILFGNPFKNDSNSHKEMHLIDRARGNIFRTNIITNSFELGEELVLYNYCEDYLPKS